MKLHLAGLPSEDKPFMPEVHYADLKDSIPISNKRQCTLCVKICDSVSIDCEDYHLLKCDKVESGR